MKKVFYLTGFIQFKKVITAAYSNCKSARVAINTIYKLSDDCTVHKMPNDKQLFSKLNFRLNVLFFQNNITFLNEGYSEKTVFVTLKAL